MHFSVPERQSTSPVLSEILNYVDLTTCARADAFLSIVEGKLIQEQRSKLWSQKTSFEQLLVYVSECLLASYVIECAQYKHRDGSMIINKDTTFHREDWTGAFHPVKKRWLDEWGFNVIKLISVIESKTHQNEDDTNNDLEQWKYLRSAIGVLIHARMVCHEIDFCGYASGFTLETFEPVLIQKGILKFPLSPIRQLDNDLLIEDLRIAVKNNSVQLACQLVESVLSFKNSPYTPEELFSPLITWKIPDLVNQPTEDGDTAFDDNVEEQRYISQDTWVVVKKHLKQLISKARMGGKMSELFD